MGVSGSFHLRVRWPTFFITHAQLCHDVMTQAVHVPWCSAGSIPVFKTGGGTENAGLENAGLEFARPGKLWNTTDILDISHLCYYFMIVYYYDSLLYACIRLYIIYTTLYDFIVLSIM